MSAHAVKSRSASTNSAASQNNTFQIGDKNSPAKQQALQTRDLMRSVFGMQADKELGVIPQVCRTWRTLSNEPTLWNQVLQQRFPTSGVETGPNSKALFIRALKCNSFIRNLKANPTSRYDGLPQCLSAVEANSLTVQNPFEAIPTLSFEVSFKMASSLLRDLLKNPQFSTFDPNSPIPFYLEAGQITEYEDSLPTLLEENPDTDSRLFSLGSQYQHLANEFWKSYNKCGPFIKAAEKALKEQESCKSRNAGAANSTMSLTPNPELSGPNRDYDLAIENKGEKPAKANHDLPTWKITTDNVAGFQHLLRAYYLFQRIQATSKEIELTVRFCPRIDNYWGFM
jgi:hypothetical protein